MRKHEVEIGKVYRAKVGYRWTYVTILSVSPYGGWTARNEITGREVRIRTGARLSPAGDNYAERIEDLKGRIRR